MKKLIIMALVVAFFGFAGLALAQESSNGDPWQEVWTAINDIRGQLANLPAESTSVSGASRNIYSLAITDNLDKADYVSPKNEEAGNYYFAKINVPQISVSDLPLISVYGKEDPQNIRFGEDAWEKKNPFTYIKDGELYLLFAEKQEGQDPSFYLPKGIYKVVVIY